MTKVLNESMSNEALNALPIVPIDGRQPANEKEEKHFLKQSEEAKAEVEPRLLVSYEKIRNNFRNGLAVVPVLRDACGGCFYAIPPQKQSEIKQHKKIVACENCGRILVDEELHNSIELK